MSINEKIREYISAWKRIILLSKRPDEEEFNLLTKLNFLGFIIVGAIGYIIHLVYVLLVS
ncbi:MAG: protein translocase SEC61 complex subunit gamma [Caldisphaeraceae archaeon]|nr:protein translocase SEC61 complex subunit gamma [Caldisphaeraceae archaeon]MEB3692133.1 protein translocase SEC61 complex subunit gamma [Caldisphaeraceae archaeon]MEB3797916.1 protein translocase SEC61 complex subunit gamma [Caldisphaeraceae archaeon]